MPQPRDISQLSPEEQAQIEHRRRIGRESYRRHEAKNRERALKAYRADRERSAARALAWNQANRDRYNASRRQSSAMRRQDPLQRAVAQLRSRMSQAMRRPNARPGSAVRDLGCSYAELRAHLEAQFAEGMSWENYGRKGWHIDHVRPLASFDLTDREQFLQACHYSNLQPLWWYENLAKGAS